MVLFTYLKNRGIWGWDDSYIFAGNKKKGVDVISAYTKTLVTTLESPHMSAIPCRFDAHPFRPGMLLELLLAILMLIS